MSRLGFAELQKPLQVPGRDSLELASLAESDGEDAASESSSVSGVPSSRRLSFDNEDPLDDNNLSVNANRSGRMNRSYSVSSAFDYTPALFPLSSTAGGYTAIGTPNTPNFDRSGGVENLDGSLGAGAAARAVALGPRRRAIRARGE